LVDNADLEPSKITSYTNASKHLLPIPKNAYRKTSCFKDSHLCLSNIADIQPDIFGNYIKNYYMLTKKNSFR